MTNNAFLESDRLFLRWFIPEDFELSRHLDIDPEVKKYIGPTLGEDEILVRFNKALIYGKAKLGLGKWMAVEKETGDAIGWFVLNFADKTASVEIGYRLKESSWGKGYATEMSRVLLHHAYETCHLDKVIGLTHQDNIASQQVLRKIGLQYIGIRSFYNVACSYFELSRDEYSRRNTH